ncbi:class I glutamine amidotransferase-like protein [Cristinia sonorae]|uniref:Class I glutamine amidotransferase-like protein n=1 Tax=Cristinia sonorae TaxID=1940300 RepID=A0A8K0UDD2_9AGAR|nr:class I glutamine amidotransferase-like protein [Cristinia sonorae]
MSAHNSPKILKLALCLFNDVTALDFQGPLELFGFIARPNVIEAETLIKPVYLGPSPDPIKPWAGAPMIPTRTYDSVGEDEQFDIILIPGGARPKATPQSLLSFIRRQAPGAKYVLSVCTGSWILAQAGVLHGKRATTNKADFKTIRDTTTDLGITWVAKARWVVDGNYWTSSGVTAGIDMANAFLTHLIGEEPANQIRILAEANVRGEGDDDFAEIYGLA